MDRSPRERLVSYWRRIERPREFPEAMGGQGFSGHPEYLSLVLHVLNEMRKINRRLKRRGFNSRVVKVTPKRKARTNSFAKRVKRVMLRTSEPKHTDVIVGKIELYHNGGALFAGMAAIQLNKSTGMPAQGITDQTRVGDQINIKSFDFRMLCGQKADRPNVTFRYWVLKLPKGSAFAYTSWFRSVIGNILLDDPNTDFVKVVKTGVLRPNQASLASDVNEREYTFTKRIHIPYKKLVKFGPADGAVTTNDPVDLWFVMGVYDAYGSLGTDNIAYCQSMFTINYCDP